MIHGWRSSIHYWSRRGEAVKKAAFMIALGSFFASWLLIPLMKPQGEPMLLDPLEQKVREDWKRLFQASDARPRELSRWLRQLTPILPMLADSLEMPVPTWVEYQTSGKLLTYEVKPLLARHTLGAGQAVLLEDYLLACLSAKTPDAVTAAERVREQAAKSVPLANELHASLLLRETREAEALAAFLREMTLFPEDQLTLDAATRLALKLKDDAVLRQISMGQWRGRLSPMMEHHVGLEIGDLRMQWRGLLRHRLSTLSWHALSVGLFAALIWYVILVLHIPAQTWRWLWPVLPMLAGIMSIWPTVSISAWQTRDLGIVEEAPFPLDLWRLIIGVGLREELCKLALAAFFMPWLLHRRSPGAALMTGAFVGLGFALEENLDYYQDHGIGVALVRFLSANFLHVALTGIATHSLYDMLRSRFARAQAFVSTLGTLVVAHALYDYQSPAMPEISAYLPMLVLAVIAWQFWDLVEAEMPHSRQLIAPSAVFLIGTALVIAVSFILGAVQTPGHDKLISTAMQCVGFLPVAVIYWRRLGA
jgi:RsiW-degrading membrane proteinase PrsW (M82 family)